MKRLFVLAACVALTGCAGLQQAVQAYGSVAVTNAKATNDTLVEAYKVGLCALPLSAIARHPEIISAIRTLCIAPGDTPAARLLDDAEARLLDDAESHVLDAIEVKP